jgi:cellobiose-specific phosphotransferase system component IIB
MDKNTIYSKTGKGVLEIKNKAGKLPKDLVRLLSLIDGKSTVADLMAKAKLDLGEINKALGELTTGGYIKEFANTSTGTQGGSGSYVDDLDFTSSLSPGKNVYQNAQSEWRQRETADRAKAEQEAKLKREQEEQLKKAQAEKLAREESARLAKVEMERKAKEAAGQKLREEAERKAKVEAEVMARTQRDLAKILEAERQAFELAERKKLEAEHLQSSENAARRAREEAERRIKEDEERRRQEAQQLDRRDEERKRAEDDRRAEDERRRKEDEQKRAAEAERKRKEDDERRRREEEDRRRADEERRRKEDEERKRREEEDRRRREEEERKRKEEEERKRKEEEERKRKEEKERKRKEEEERKRKEEEQRRQQEEDRRRREESEARARQEAEERRRREEDERSREQEARARREAEAAKTPAKSEMPEFDLSGLRAMESQVAAEFEKQQQELRKREEEEERRRAEEEQARLAVERAEREEQARAEAERREAEDRERRERMELERQERDNRERKREEERQARIREQEESKVKREQERLRQEAMKVENERRAREEDLVRRRKEQEERDRKRAEVDSLKKHKGVKTPLDRLKPVAIGAVLLIGALIGIVQLVPMNAYVPSIEKLASAHIKEPVSIGSMHLSILDGFKIVLQNVKIGTAQDVKIDKISLSAEVGSLFADVKVIHKIEADSVTMAEEVLPRLHKWLDSSVADRNLQVDRLVGKSIKLDLRNAKLTPFDADIQLSREGAIEKAVLSSIDAKLNVELVPHDNQIDIALTAAKGWVPPLGPQIEFTDLTVKAVATRDQIRVEKFNALLYGGAATGAAVIVWGGPWAIDGEVATERIGLQDLMAVFTRDAKSTGHLQSKLRYSMSSQTLASLFDSPKVDGSFDIKKGDVDGVDLVRALQSGGRGVTQGGATRFEEITGTLSLQNGRYQYRNVRLASGLLSSSGTFDVSPAKDVSGRILVELRSQAAQIKGNFIVDGDLKAIVLRPN